SAFVANSEQTLGKQWFTSHGATEVEGWQSWLAGLFSTAQARGGPPSQSPQRSTWTGHLPSILSSCGDASDASLSGVRFSFPPYGRHPAPWKGKRAWRGQGPPCHFANRTRQRGDRPRAAPSALAIPKIGTKQSRSIRFRRAIDTSSSSARF